MVPGAPASILETIDFRSLGVSTAGDICFMGVRTDTNEKVLGTVPAGVTEVTLLSSEHINAEEAVSFTAIN